MIRKLVNVVGVIVIFVFLSVGGVSASEIIRLIDGSFDASASWGQSVRFTPPSDGKLVITFENPDSSADGKLQLIASKPNWGGSPYSANKLWDRHILTGYAAEPATSNPVTIGVPLMRTEVSISQGIGEVNIGIGYGPDYWGGGVDNTGTDRITVDFVSETIADLLPQAQYLGRFYAYNAGDETTVNLHAETPGFLIQQIIQKAGQGGWHMVYSNGLSIGGIQASNLYGDIPDYKVLPMIDAGDYSLRIKYEGTTHTSSEYKIADLYYLPIDADKTPPTVTISATPDKLWPPNGKMVDVTISGWAADNLSGVASVEFTVTDEYGKVEPVITGFNTTIALESSREETDKDGRQYTITAIATDRAGNKSTASTVVTILHDQR